jgi:hypothetical protein
MDDLAVSDELLEEGDGRVDEAHDVDLFAEGEGEVARQFELVAGASQDGNVDIRVRSGGTLRLRTKEDHKLDVASLPKDLCERPLDVVRLGLHGYVRA